MQFIISSLFVKKIVEMYIKSLGTFNYCDNDYFTTHSSLDKLITNFSTGRYVITLFLIFAKRRLTYIKSK